MYVSGHTENYNSQMKFKPLFMSFADMENYRNAIESEFNLRLRGLRSQLADERAKSEKEKQQHKQELEMMKTKLEEEKDEKKALQV